MVADGTATPVVTDGPFAESKELLAGYRMIDVESAGAGGRDRRAGLRGARPGRRADRRRIEVREVMWPREACPRRRATTAIEDLLRDAAPRVLAAVVRRFGDFADAEDAVQEAMIDGGHASGRTQGTPESPVGWLIAVASRRMTDQIRADSARRAREERLARSSLGAGRHGQTTRLALIFMCCRPGAVPGLGDRPHAARGRRPRPRPRSPPPSSSRRRRWAGASPGQAERQRGGRARSALPAGPERTERLAPCSASST